MKNNESDTFPSAKPAAYASPNVGCCTTANSTDDACLAHEPSRFTTAFRLEPRNTEHDDAVINASKFRSPGRLKAQRTKGAPPIGLRRKLAKGLLPTGPIQACKAARFQCLPSSHQCGQANQTLEQIWIPPILRPRRSQEMC